MGNFFGNFFHVPRVEEDSIDGYRNEMVQYHFDEAETDSENIDLDEVISSLEENINRYSAREGIDVEYIGKASGSDAESAMKNRVDKPKRNLEINEMRLLYKTEHEDNAFKVESALVEYSIENHAEICKNKRGGGGGRRSTAPWHYVYAAYHRNGSN